MQIGEDRYYAWFDDDDAKVQVDLYRVRSIKRRRNKFSLALGEPRASLIEVNGTTWGKRSKKHGDFGWRDPIWPGFRQMVEVGSPRARRYAKTKGAAIRAALADERSNRVFYKDSAEIVAECDVIIQALAKALKRQR